MFIEIALTMFVVGLLLGFVGAGGSGFIIAILTVVFGLPIHTVFGTALAAMVFTTISGAASHYRERNTYVKSGVLIGLFGALGAWIGSLFAVYIPGDELKWMTAGMQFLSSALLWVRMYMVSRKKNSTELAFNEGNGKSYWMNACLIGLATGILSGTFGIGSTPFIQVGLMAVLGMPVRQAAGTTMMIIVPTALSGGLSYYSVGYFDTYLLLEIVTGTMLGSYIGAKFTKRVPIPVLRWSLIVMPIVAGIILLF